MKYGNLRDYLRRHNNKISIGRRFEWTLRAAEGLRILHSTGIIHCDFSPRNLLLDDKLQVKVADFGGCSINGSWSSAMGSARFQQPCQIEALPTIHADIFSLGSTIYEIMTGSIPYEDVSSSQVRQLVRTFTVPQFGWSSWGRSNQELLAAESRIVRRGI